MNLAIVLPAAAVLLLVAIAGAATPVRSGRLPPLDPLGDALEDRRTALLIALSDLETARGSGAVDAEEYARARAETEQRMAQVLRALDERRAGRPAGGDGRPRRTRTTMLSWVAIVVVAAGILGAIVGPSLVRSLNERDAGPSLANSASISFFEKRVRNHPNDVAAILDLAHRYFGAGRLGDAYDQYAAALSLQPRNSEALANLGILLHLSGKPERGLRLEERALKVDPDNSEALFFEGVILMRGLDRPAPALRALRAYLRASPFGPEVDEARRLVREARRTPAGR